MINRYMLRCVLPKIVLLTALFGMIGQATAAPRIGTPMDLFLLQGTDGKAYGMERAAPKVSVLFFVGYS